MLPCLSWGGSSREPPVPTGHVDGQDRPLSGHLWGLMTEDQVLTPLCPPGLSIVSDPELRRNRDGGGEKEARRA